MKGWNESVETVQGMKWQYGRIKWEYTVEGWNDDSSKGWNGSKGGMKWQCWMWNGNKGGRAKWQYGKRQGQSERLKWQYGSIKWQYKKMAWQQHGRMKLHYGSRNDSIVGWKLILSCEMTVWKDERTEWRDEMTVGKGKIAVKLAK
jgi:hypothetical protein